MWRGSGRKARSFALIAAAAFVIRASNVQAQLAEARSQQTRAALRDDAASLPERPPGSEEALERETLVEEVLARNPSLVAARAAHRAAHARVAPARAFEDLMISYSLAPLSIASDRVPFGQTIEVAQALPWPGERALRAELAKAEGRAMESGVEEARQRLSLSASQLYDRYYFVYRALAINDQHIALLESLKGSAEAQYIAGRASQQDALQAEVELGQLLRERLALEAEAEAVRAELNALLHRAPDAPLPAPPTNLEPALTPPEPSARLQEQATAQRPELAALRARAGARESARDLAQLGFRPDLRVMGTYSSMWMERPHQFMAGVSLNIPWFQLRARRAEIEGAEAELENVRAAESDLLDSIRSTIHRARAELVEAQAAVALYRTRVLPATRDQVAAARAGFTAGRNSFQTVIAAERSLRATELQLEQTIAATHTRRAALSWAIGRDPFPPRSASAPTSATVQP